MSRNKGLIDEMADLTSRSVKFGIRLFGFAVNISCRLFCATLEGIDEAFKPKEEIKVKPPKEKMKVEPPKREIKRKEEKQVTKKPEKKKRL